ncbi:MAG: hypothetical protein ABJB47_24470, partial [Actinomycetota bacterium]
MLEDQRRMILETRARTPSAVADAAARRQRRPLLGPSGRLMIIAADHTARGALGAGGRPLAMANRFDLLDRILVALGRRGVDGVLATADVIEDLMLLGALDHKLAIGSMNRGGITGAAFEIDDRFTGYSAAAIAASGLDGGKMLLRMDMDDPATATSLAACAGAVSDLASHQVMAMIEPFIARRTGERTHNDLGAPAVIRSIAIASGLGVTSAYTWLKIPVVDDMEQVAEASTLPTMLLGGESDDRPDEMFARWQKALRLPNVRGLAVGRNILYPPG